MATLPEPEFAEVERYHAEHFKLIGKSADGFDIFECVGQPQGGYPAYQIGKLYWFEEDGDGWLPLNLGYEARNRRDYRCNMRDRAAELAAQHGSPEEVAAKAESLFNFLTKDNDDGHDS